MLRKLLAFTCLTLSMSVNAGTISYNGYSLDTDTRIVTGAGLRWHQWNTSINIEDALTENPGWRLATNEEMTRLFNSFDLGGSFTADENSGQYYETSRFVGENDELRTLFAPEQWRFGYFVAALYGNDADDDGLYNLALVINEYNVHEGINRAHLTADAYSSTYCIEGPRYGCVSGVALVSPIPIPAAAWLFGSALLGLGAVKRKKA